MKVLAIVTALISLSVATPVNLAYETAEKQDVSDPNYCELADLMYKGATSNGSRNDDIKLVRSNINRLCFCSKTHAAFATTGAGSMSKHDCLDVVQENCAHLSEGQDLYGCVRDWVSENRRRVDEPFAAPEAGVEWDEDETMVEDEGADNGMEGSLGGIDGRCRLSLGLGLLVMPSSS
ncbi:hypothetical protein GQ602_001115 [Ophiocordyceps camponoti-floridani]|uniref:Uncharacterized protein n=1 Tax=Ophiocordyceps camponoti-floridani TaxID=2030778 RepID=A0A8H4QDJ7_9HYPO|nr:hypothetical protein GQ602_001115 [Ophiocordyceps camponoti-floridani]